MVIVKTKMREIPETCRECELHVFMQGNVGCIYAREWIEPYQWSEGKKKLEDCPLEEE